MAKVNYAIEKLTKNHEHVIKYCTVFYSTKIRLINASELFVQYRVKPNIIIGVALILALTA